jgi:hypothetical protein
VHAELLGADAAGFQLDRQFGPVIFVVAGDGHHLDVRKRPPEQFDGLDESLARVAGDDYKIGTIDPTRDRRGAVELDV